MKAEYGVTFSPVPYIYKVSMDFFPVKGPEPYPALKKSVAGHA
jgi:hypothetical protein